MDIDSDILNIPDLDFDIECDFSGNFYTKIMDSVAVTESDVVVIGSKDNELKIKAKGDNTEMEISLSKENNTETRTSIQKVDGKNKLVKTKQLLYTLHQCKETFEAEFALRYLKQFTKPISIVDKIGFYVSPEMPMKLEFMINDKNGSLIEYFIAPKISDV